MVSILSIFTICEGTFSEPFRQFLREKYGEATEQLLTRTDVGGGGSYGGGVKRPDKPTELVFRAYDRAIFRHRPVIIVHGITNSAGTFSRIQQYFLKNGYADEEVYGTTYGDAGKTNVLFVTMQCHYVKIVSAPLESLKILENF